MLIRLMRSKFSVGLFSLVSLGLLVYGGKMAVSLAADKVAQTPAVLYDIGAAPVSLEQLKKETVSHSLSFYWLGEMPNRFMTIDHETPGSIALRYSDNAQKSSAVVSPAVSVITHIDQAHYDQSMRGAVHVALDSVISNSRGDVVIINSSLLNEMVVKMRGTETIVSITYEAKQSETSLIRDSERLSLFNPN